MRHRGPFAVVLVVALALTLAFLILPVVAIFADTPPGELIDSLGSDVAQDALWLSLKTTRGGARDHRRRRHPRRLPAGDPGLPRQGGR